MDPGELAGLIAPHVTDGGPGHAVGVYRGGVLVAQAAADCAVIEHDIPIGAEPSSTSRPRVSSSPPHACCCSATACCRWTRICAGTCPSCGCPSRSRCGSACPTPVACGSTTRCASWRACRLRAWMRRGSCACWPGRPVSTSRPAPAGPTPTAVSSSPRRHVGRDRHRDRASQVEHAAGEQPGGGAWIVPDGGGAVRLGHGDVAVIRGPDPYTVADDPATPPQAVIHPGQRCTSPDGQELKQMTELGARTWGNSPDGATVLLTGTYHLDGEVSQRLLRALPAVLVLPEGEWDCPLIPLLADEIVKDEPGQEAVLDRLLDLLLIAVLRAWFARPGTDALRWYRAYGDPVVGRALRLLHHNPAHPWTVAELAAAANVSRASLARRFTELVGEPPMAFLTSWRLALAADLLREPGATIGAVASQVGYGSPFALSTAFKRVRGVSPRHHRAGALRD